ncbi:tyrosine-type recombinase/integrase [Hymenobacter sp. BT186]|uniref:Tyrosine-type recombinase/integrase n=1 Tax=Hymenobacter telluris TaxID=2816474 RepID=A0A939EZQ3_9BACT|nr:tyrosine-type recombinase/integrase [Hymenobacter telluris]MBO0360839.1 tyrosine-type recombinase/integrase [Hymenobacter telluris]MBW3376868.1 tyrosine-type recombinase/integrase [Hymenobacter norwichensis]
MNEDLSLVLAANANQSVSAQLARASAKVAGFLEVGLQGAANTERAYTSDLKGYVAFCEQHGLQAMPADVDTLTEYVAYLASEKPESAPREGRRKKGQQPLTGPHALATIKRHLAAIRKAHQLAGYRLPATLDALNLVMEGITRTLGKRQVQAQAFTVEELKQAIRRIDLDTSAGIRDRALLLLGFAGAFRRSELVELNIEQLEFTERALLVHLAKSKTNQYGAVEDKAIFYAPTLDFCPVRCLRAWLNLLGRTTGPLFVKIPRTTPGQLAVPSTKRLSDISINKLVQKRLGPAYSAHSLRVSFVTTAVLNGQSHKAIKNQTKQKTDAMIERYTQLNNVVSYNAAQSLGL